MASFWNRNCTYQFQNYRRQFAFSLHLLLALAEYSPSDGRDGFLVSTLHRLPVQNTANWSVALHLNHEKHQRLLCSLIIWISSKTLPGYFERHAITCCRPISTTPLNLSSFSASVFYSLHLYAPIANWTITSRAYTDRTLLVRTRKMKQRGRGLVIRRHMPRLGKWNQYHFVPMAAPGLP